MSCHTNWHVLKIQWLSLIKRVVVFFNEQNKVYEMMKFQWGKTEISGIAESLLRINFHTNT